jgi:signal transduction histidine kinase
MLLLPSQECMRWKLFGFSQSNKTMSDPNQKLVLPAGKNYGLDERGAAGQLALELMHEIRNPLEALGHLVYLVRHDTGNPELISKYMDLAQEQVSTLNQIASQTLGFARLSASRKPIDLVDLAEAALRIHQRTIEAKKIHLVKRSPPDLEAPVHSGQILQVVSNLIVNALDALPERGTLSIRLRKRESSFDIVVADNGTGVAEEHVDRIFEPFYSTKEDQGNGLGLALAKRIVEDHGGTLRMRTSVQPQRNGTAFRISLPR